MISEFKRFIFSFMRLYSLDDMQYNDINHKVKRGSLWFSTKLLNSSSKKNQHLEFSEKRLNPSSKVIVVLEGKIFLESIVAPIEAGQYLIIRESSNLRTVYAIENSKVLLISSDSEVINVFGQADIFDENKHRFSQGRFISECINSGKKIPFTEMSVILEILKVHDPLMGDEFNRYFDFFLNVFDHLPLEPTKLSKSYCARMSAQWVYQSEDTIKAINDVVLFLQKAYQDIFMPTYSETLIRNVVYWILIHSNEKKTVQYLAKKLYLNRTYLSEQFIKITGMPLSQYILKVKLYGAMILLIDKNLSNADIIEILGYKDESHFSKNFKAFSGLSPSEFSKKYRPIAIVMNQQNS